MRVALACLSLSLLLQTPLSHAAPQKTAPWTVQEIYSGADPGAAAPGEFQWAPGGKRATFMNDAGDLMQIDPATGHVSKLVSHTKLSTLGHANLSEKDADHRARYHQADYLWAPDGKRLLLDPAGELWLFNLANGTGVEVANSGAGSGDDPKFSPDGKYLSYLRDHNLYLKSLDAANPTPPVALTNTHEMSVLNGEVDWIYNEELNVRSNYFWAPDSRQVAYLQMNESAVPQYPLVDWIPEHAAVDQQRYPQPGDANATVRVGVVGTSGGATRWIHLPFEPGNDYIPRFGWVDARDLWIETLSRDHKKMDLYFADSRTQEVKLVLEQTDPKYFTTTYDVSFGPGEFLLVSWQDGYRHIYRYKYDRANPLGAEAKPAGQLESGDYEVFSIKSVDGAMQTVYYESNEGNPREQQLWAVKLDGTGKHKVSSAPGVHETTFHEGSSVYLDKHSNASTPPEVDICQAEACKQVWRPASLKGHALIAPELLTLKAADGKTVLYGTLTLPAGKTSVASVPLIVNPYGGPGVAADTDRWKGPTAFFDTLLAEHGFAVLHVDNRGMAGRGRDFEQACYHDFGKVQLADQLASIDQVLRQHPQLDPTRLGWWGWSWGGTFTLNALTHSDRFLAGVSVAPVTDFRDYDSIYTERYLGLPGADPEVYNAASVQATAKDLKGHLLLVHGTGDDNVHLENSVQFIQKLMDANIPYDFQIYPRKTHSIAGPEARTHLFSRILTHFETYLLHPQGAAR